MSAAYLIGVLIWAMVHGFNTRHGDVGRDADLARLIAASLAWPLILTAAIGHSFRMLSVRRIAEDAADGFVPR